MKIKIFTLGGSIDKFYSTQKSTFVVGEPQIQNILQEARNLIEESGPCQIDYIELVDPEAMQPLDRVDLPMLAAVAVRIGSSRLIDNLLINDGRTGR